MAPKRSKRDSSQVDRLMAEVDKLHSKGMSVNRACGQVGIQPTVYYFRKRKDAAILNNNATTSSSSISAQAAKMYENKDLDTLTREYRELENRMQAIKMQIAEKVMSKDNNRNT